MEIRVIPGHPKYGAGEDGNIYSRVRGPWKIMFTHKNEHGYQYVGLARTPHRRVSRYVYLTWFGEIPHKMTINHIDGNKDNNKPDNLELMTMLQNRRHAMETGLWHPTPRSAKKCKYNEMIVSVLKKLYYDEMMTQREIARIWGMTQGYVSLILKGKRWM